MGNYASTAELETRFADTTEVEVLTNQAIGSGVDTAVLDDVIEVAEGEIDSALAQRFLTPVDVTLDTSLDALLKSKTLDLAEFYLYRRGSKASQLAIDQHQEVLDWLDKIQKGERRLVGAVTVPSTVSGNPRAEWTDSGRELPDTSSRIFTRPSTRRL
ncbi:MAG: DUF1320 domain-containing protein [Planctomycetota bacterium]|nr:DUF1320 domain-containing protein [Planctomycetota bacterium]